MAPHLKKKGGFNRGYGGHWAADGKPNSPPSLPYTTATMRVHAGRDSAPEPKITIIPSFLLREWKLLLFCFRYYFFGSYSFFLGIDIFFDESWRAFQKYQLFYYRASQVLARVGFLYLRFLTIQLQAHPPTVDAHELHRVALTRHLNEILRGVAF